MGISADLLTMNRTVSSDAIPGRFVSGIAAGGKHETCWPTAAGQLSRGGNPQDG